MSWSSTTRMISSGPSASQVPQAPLENVRVLAVHRNDQRGRTAKIVHHLAVMMVREISAEQTTPTTTRGQSGQAVSS